MGQAGVLPLRAFGDIAGQGKMRQEPFHCGGFHFSGMPFIGEANKLYDPMHTGLIGFVRQTL